MALSNTSVTITPEELFAISREQVEPHLHDRLLAEIERRWPDGLRVLVHLAPTTPTNER